MIKKCAISNGKIINIGEWDYQIDENNVTNNPLPDGAIIEEREFECDADRGWYEVGTVSVPTIEEQLQAQAEAITALMEVLASV